MEFLKQLGIEAMNAGVSTEIHGYQVKVKKKLTRFLLSMHN